MYNINTSSFAGPKYTISKSKKFLQPKHKTDLDQNLPISYIGNTDFSSNGVKNYSLSNLPKQDRFRLRDAAEREMSTLAGPANYNLSDALSIKK